MTLTAAIMTLFLVLMPVDGWAEFRDNIVCSSLPPNPPGTCFSSNTRQIIEVPPIYITEIPNLCLATMEAAMRAMSPFIIMDKRPDSDNTEHLRAPNFASTSDDCTRWMQHNHNVKRCVTMKDFRKALKLWTDAKRCWKQ